MIIIIWTCAAGTAKEIPYLSKAEQQANRQNCRILPRSPAHLKPQLLGALVGYFFFMIASGIYDTLNIHIATYFWELKPSEIKLFPVVGLFAGIAGALLSQIDAPI